ncbi:hypothetical protein GCM10012275_18330 [Longimycelium tulufanense]|uniref:Uncharacterized protein n=1 Tax=Longimycelium tulufanense TaxID=907463 RepID=A0A8J3CCW8_9PSEU|nr:hypothetical protein [Longimycelium tulufanense]GGM47582.1 hypothetical protein GCM10012275_18330 [Longimycelium tulufanense]
MDGSPDRRRSPSLGAVLDALDAGRIAELSSSKGGPAEGAGPRARREFARPTVRKELSALVALALVDVGVASWDLPGRARSS